MWNSLERHYSNCPNCGKFITRLPKYSIISRYTGGSVDNSKSGPPLNACNFAAVIQTLFYQKFFTILFFFPLARKKCPARLDRKGPRRAISSPLAYPDRVSGTSAARYIVYRRVKIKDWPDHRRRAHAVVATDIPCRKHRESATRTVGSAGDGPFGRT